MTTTNGNVGVLVVVVVEAGDHSLRGVGRITWPSCSMRPYMSDNNWTMADALDVKEYHELIEMRCW